MSAQELYITGLLESFSTFCEQNGVPSVVFQEAQLGLVSLLKSVQTKNWHLNDTSKFLLEFDKNTQVSPAAKALVIQFVKDYPPLQTAVFLRQYLLALTNNGCSLSTVKNYRSDINQFFVFCKNNDLELIFVKPKALSFLRKEQTDNASSATLKRKLSSLTQFGNWLTDIGFFKPGQIKWLIDLNRNPNFEKEISESRIATITQNTPDHPGEASRLLSLTRLLPRMRSGTHASSRAPLQAGLQGFSAGLSRAASGLSSYTSPKHQEHNHQLRTSLQELQSKLNKRTNQWLFSYINVAFIALFAIGLSYFGYMQFFVQPPATQAFPTSLTRPNRTLSFQGRLTDTAQNPVTAATNFRFRLYDSGPSTVGGTSLWDSGTCSVTPDQDGIFSTGLGTDCGAEIDSSVFSENANVWLQVEVAGETLSPRQSIKSVAYALNSETLQGYPPADPATANTVLVMNSSGEVSLGTSAPKIKASTGTLTLEGTAVTLQTTSNGNIALSPNGTGNVIASRYFSAPGATFSATYAGGTALVTRGGPSGTANIQEWQNNGGSALSIVNSAGNFGIGTTTTRAALDVNGDASTSGSLVFRGSSPATLDVLNGSRFDFQNSPGGDAGLVARLSILLNGNVGIGTTNPSGKLQITGDEVRIGSAGTINFATGDGDMYVQDYLEVDGTINGTSILQNGNTVCDASGNCTNSGLWQNSANAFHPRNEWAGVADLLLGGTSTASAKFGFINVASGTPTATISGNLSIVTPTGPAPSTTYNVLNGGSFNLRTSVGGDANLTSRLFVSNSGNVGLGSSSPTQSLDVFGDLRLRGNDITDSSDTTRLSVGATTTLTNTTTVLSGTATLTASSLATMTTSSSVNWGGATSLTFTADNASIYGSDSANGDLTFEGTSSGTKTSSYVLLQPNGGNVGIGSATPSMALDVQGDTAAHFQARFRNPTNGIGNITAGTYSALGETYSARSTLVGNNVYADTVNTVGGQLLYRNTHASYGHAALLMSGGDIYFYNKTESVTAGAVVTKNLTMIIDGTDGNVGIGTATPTQLLHVQGNMRVTGAYYDSSNSAGTTGYLMLSTGTGTAWTNPESLNDLGWWDNTANVLHPRGANAGVVDFAIGGTSTDSAKFAIINMATGTPTATMSGNLSLITPTGAAPATTYNVLNGGTFNLRTSVGGDADLTSRIFVANAGNVGVGTTSPTQKLDVNGDLRVRGNDITDSGDATRITLGATTTLTNTTTTLSGTSTLTASSLATMTTSTDVDWGGIDNLVFTGDNTTVYGSDSSGGDLTLEGTSNGTKTASYVLLQPNGGNVGIGTTAAGSALLQVFGAADQLRLAYDISNYTQFSGKSNGDMHMDPTGALYLNGTYTASNSFIVGSTGALTLNSAADSSFTGAGNVGVGTASSISQKLHVQGNLRVTGAYYDSANSPGSNGYLMLSTGSGTAWTNPDALLDLGWWDNTNNALHPRNEYAGVVDLVVGGNSTASADFRVQGQNAVSGTLAGYTYGRRFLDIDDSTYYVEPGNTTTAGLFASNVGIGTTGASVRLHSVATTEQLRLGYNASNYSSFTVGSTGALTLAQTGTGGAINLNSSLASGGTTTAALNLKTTTDLGTNDEVFQVGDSAADFLTIRGDGNTGVGTTAPTQVLDVNGDLRVRGNDITDSADAIRVSLGATTTLTNTTTTLSGTTTLTASSLATMTTSSTVAWGGATSLTFTADNAVISGSDVANGNLSLQGTTNATRTTSYVLLQPNGGNVGIGTTSPGNKFHVEKLSQTHNTEGSSSIMASNGTKRVEIGYDTTIDAGFIWAYHSSTGLKPLVLNAAGGNVGIGTTAPAHLLEINGAAATAANGIGFGTSGTVDVELFRGAANRLDLASGDSMNLVSGAYEVGGTDVITSARLVQGANGAVGAPSLSFSSDADTGFYTDGSNKLQITTGGTNRMVVDSAGNVGIGTTDPASFKLQVAGNIGPQTDSTHNLGSLALAWANIYGDTVYQNGNQVCDESGNCTSSGLWQNTNNAFHPRDQWATVADVLIGSTATNSAKFAFMNVASGTPTASISGNLALSAPTGAAPAVTQDIFNNGTFNLRQSPGGNALLTSRLFISNNGNVGISSTTPGAKLDVAGTGIIDTLTLDGTSGTALNISSSSITTDINLQNSETIDNNTDGTINLGTTILSLTNTNTITASSLTTFTTSANLAMSSTTGLTLGNNAVINLGASTGGTINGSTAGDGDLTLQGTSNATRTTSYVNIQPNGGNVGIGGETAPVSKVEIRQSSTGTGYGGTNGAGALRISYSTGYGVGIDTWDGGTPRWGILSYSVDTPTVVMEGRHNSPDVVFNAGNVGIGTTGPTQALHVGGNLRVTGAYYDSSNSAGSDNYILTSTGVGTQTAWTNPEAILDSGWWDNSLNVIHPRGAFASIADLVIGGNSTASADFQVIGSGANAGYVEGRRFIDIDSTNYYVEPGNTSISAAFAGNVGIGTTNPDTNLEIVNGSQAFSSTNVRYYNNLAQYNNSVASNTGTMKIALPKTWSNTMMRMRIEGYNYSSGVGAWEVIVSGYSYSAGTAWINYTAEIKGSAPFTQVRLAHDGTNIVVLLGDTSTVWNYPKIVVSEFTAGHSNITGWGSGWTIGTITSEAGITNIVTPPIHTYITSAGNMGIGTTAPTARLDVAGDASTSGSLVFRGASTSTIDVLDGARLDFQTSAGGDTGLTNRMTILNNGNVGIGSTAPGAKLDVAGTGIMTTLTLDGTSGTALNISNAGITTDISLQNSETIDNNVDGTINLGATIFSLTGTSTITASSLSTFTTAATLGMSSTTALNLGNNAVVTLGASTGGTLNGSSIANGNLTLQGTSNGTRTTSYLLLQPTAGNVGIGTTAPAHLLEINGAAATAANGIGFGTSGTVDVEIYRSAANTLSLATGDSLNLVSGNYTQVSPVTTGTGTSSGFSLSNTTLTSGNLMDISSSATALSSGDLLSIAKTGASGSTAFTGDIAAVSYSQTFNGGVGLNSTGNVADISRAITLNNSGNTHTISGALLSLSDTMTQTAGTLTHTASVLDLTQNYTSSTGNALYLKNYGAGNALRVDDVSGDTTPFIIAADGNVGVGTTAASDTLDVNGTARIRTFGSAQPTNVCTSGTGVLSTCTAGFVDGTGTANYLARWTDTDTIGIGVTYDNGTNVGIGTTTVTQKLDVAGNIRATGGFVKSTIGTGGGGAYIQGIVDTNTSFARTSFAHNAYWDAGTALWNGEAIGANDMQAIMVPNNGGFQFITHSNTGNTARTMSHAAFTAGTKMTIEMGGNVGIGTTVPDSNLHVFGATAGTVSSYAGTTLTTESSGVNYLTLLSPDAFERGIFFGEASSNIAGGIVYNNPGTLDGFQFRTNGNNIRMVVDAAGNVGIGITTTANSKLQVYEGTSLGSTLGNSQILAAIGGSGSNAIYEKTWLYRDAAGSNWLTARIHNGISVDSSYGTPGTDTRTWWERDPNNDIQSWGTATTAYMTVNAGNVGIGVTSPANVFNVVKPAASDWQGRFQNNSGSGADVYLAHGSGYGMHIRGWNATDGIYTLQMYNNTVETNSFYNSGRATLALPSGANVGIGTSTPSQKLEVYGSLALSGQAWAQYSGGRFNVGDLAAGDGLVTEMRFKTSDTDRMSLTAGLEVGSLGFATPHGSLFTGQVGSSYTPTSGNWSSSGSTVLLSALDYSTIGFHDSGSRVDYIRVGLGVINLGYNAGWGAAHTQFGDNDLFVRTDDSGSNPGMPYMRSNGSYLVINPNASNLYLSWDSGTTNTIYFQNSNNYITNGGTWAMSGNLGIGTTVPIRKVHINGNTSDVTLRVDTTNADPNLTFTTLTQKDWSLGVDYSDSGKFKIDDHPTVGGSTRLTIDTAGNVGINTASPLAKLDILASLGAPAIKTANQTAASTSEVVMNHTWTGNGNWDLRLEQQHVSNSHLQYNWVNEWAGTGYNVLTFYAANVGIGTTTPTRQNHIYGAAQATGSITDAGNKGGTLYLQDSGGSVGNGGTLLLGAGQGYFASIKGYITDGASNTTGNLTFATRAAATDTNLTERMILDPAGNLSIYGLVLRQTGDITDWANIEVNETNVGIGKNNDAGQFFIYDNGSASLTNRTTSQNTILSVVSYENPNPSLGIRQAELALDGQYSAGLGVASTAIKNIPTGNADGTLTFWTRYFTGAEALTERMRISANGYVGIGLTPAYKLDLTGTGYGGSQDINVTGCYRDTGINVAGTCASDIRLKHSIATINDPLDIISQLKPSSYEFYDPIYGRGRQFGLIAQEVEQVKPEWVETDPTSGIKAVQYGQNLVMYSLAGVKELNTRFEEIKLDSEGEVILAGSAGNYTVTAVGSGNPINKMLAAAQVITGKVKTGLVSTQELVVTQSASIASLSVTNMTVAGQNIREYIAGIVREQVNSTSPQIATGSAQIANLTSEELTTDNLTATDASISGSLSTDIAMIDELSATNITSTGTTSLGVLMAQTATISGKLTAENLEVAGSTRLAILEAQQATVGDIRAQTADLMNATISGTLYAENIYDLNGKIAAALQEPSIMDIITNNLPEPLPEADPVSVYDSVESAGYTINPDMLAITGSEISFADGDVLLTAQAAYVEKYLQVNGLAYIAQSLGVGEDIILGTTTTISDRSLAFTPTTAEDSIFYFQPSGLGKLDFLAGTMTIESGAVAINGSLNVAGTTKTETLLTNLIQPADFGNPFQVQVAGASSQSGEIKKSRFEIINELGTPVATISAEGKANFAGGIGIGSETLNPADVASGSSATVSTNKTSGKARLQAGVTQITIEAEQITEGSLVYVTPVGSTQNQVLYVKSQTAENPETSDKEGKFVVGFDQAIGSDVNFNWWVVN